MNWRRLVFHTFTVLSFAWGTASADTSILVVGSKPDHPYGSHMYEFEGKLLAQCLSKQDGVYAEYVASWPPTKQQLENAKAFVFYSNPAGSVLLQPAHRSQFDQFMKADVGFVAIHWATGVGYDKISDTQQLRDQFRGWLGGWFRRPPCDIKVDEAKLRMVAKDHPIGRGWSNSVIRDEFYLNPVLHDRAKPLLTVNVDDKDQIVGWTFEREGQGGRSVGITLGHFHHNFAREDFRRLLVSSVLWSAKQDIPKEGPDVKVMPDKLLLPPPTKSK